MKKKLKNIWKLKILSISLQSKNDTYSILGYFEQ